jgi:acetyl-CoA acetyltransferase
MARRGYDDVALAVPVTVPYVRHSIHGAHWFIGQALRSLCDASGLKKEQLDGLTVSSFTLAPDTAVGVTQHLGLSPRWLDHIPTGGASGVMAVRRAARAVQAGDADIVACIAADTNHVDSFRQMLSSFSQFAVDPDVQSRGIGRLMLGTIEKRTAEKRRIVAQAGRLNTHFAELVDRQLIDEVVVFPALQFDLEPMAEIDGAE